MWTAAFYAGLERVSTRAHSIWISRYTPGLEATVAWGSFDMQFRNDTPNGVLILASTTPTSVTVSMWGTKEYDDIEADFGERYNVRDYDTVYDESDECLSQSGVAGFSIDVDRVFIKDGKEDHRETITTTYNPAPQVVCGPDPDSVRPSKSPKPSDSASKSASESGSGGSGGSGGSDGSGGGGGSGDGEPTPSTTKQPRSSNAAGGGGSAG
jgi:uncharacterized membrane protein YgcG